MSEAIRDQNHVPSALFESSTTPGLTIPGKINQITGRVLVESSTAAGTVQTVSIATANGFAGSSDGDPENPILTLSTTITGLLKGNGTAISAATANTDYQSPITLTTTGSSGVATFNGTTLNIPVYSSAVPTTITVANEATDTTCFLSFFTAATGDLGPKSNTSLQFNSNTGLLTTNSIAMTSAGTTIGSINRGDTSSFASMVYRTGGTDEWTVGLRNDATNTFYIRDNINTVNAIAITQGASPSTTFGGNLSVGTSNAITTGTIELGAASDTTLSRSSAGVLAVEGVVIPSISSTNTITNKRITRRLTTTNTPGATPTTNTDNVDVMNFTGLNTAITSMTSSLSGTPADGDLLEFRFLDDGTARGITWGASFAATTVALPTTTVISTCLRVLFEWRAASSKWECLATA